MHTLYRPMVTYYCTQPWYGRRQATHIKPFFRSTYPCRLFYCKWFIFNDRHVPSPFFLVCDYFKTIMDVVGSGFDSPMTRFRTLGIRIQTRMLLEPVLHTITQWGLIGFEFYQEISSFVPDFIDDILLLLHGICGDNLSGYVDFVNQYRKSLYLITLFLTCLSCDCNAGVERKSRGLVVTELLTSLEITGENTIFAHKQ